jgi:hypothetical protein
MDLDVISTGVRYSWTGGIGFKSFDIPHEDAVVPLSISMLRFPRLRLRRIAML